MGATPFRTLPTALVVVGVSVGAPAHAAGLLDKLLGFAGASKDEEQQIEYRDRAPLVVPPTIQLPAPQTPVSERSANWPKDPDAEYRKTLAADGKLPVSLRPDRIAPNGKVPVAGAARKPQVYDTPGERAGERSTMMGESGWVSPEKMGSFASPKAAETALVAGTEPPRTYLTDPPRGLRIPVGTGPIAMPKKSLAQPTALSDQEERDPLAPYRKKAPTDE